jgi:uncharacterized OB-fold protein
MTEKRFFRDGLVRESGNAPVLIGNRCNKCGKVFFPKVDFCPQCLSEKLEGKELSRKGTLHAYTITRIKVANFEPPYPLGIIFLEEDNLSILAPLIMDMNEKLKAGTKMEMIIAPLWVEEDGTEVYGYKFKRCEDCD